MAEIHLICRREGISLKGLKFDRVNKRYRSGNWRISPDEAAQLISAKIYLHPSKAEGATIGGTIEELIGPDFQGRYVFVFMSEAECKGAAWAGKSHEMAWSGGVIDD